MTAACRAPSSPRPEGSPATGSTAPVTTSAGPDGAACAPCHAEIVERFAASAHRLGARRFDDARHPPRARFDTEAPVDALARAVMGLRPAGEAPSPDAPAPADLVIPDADGASETRTPTHVIGGVRREDFLAAVGDAHHVLPASWSVARASWVNPTAEELGGEIEGGAPSFWTSPRRAHENACSRCHPLPEKPEPSGITCASCHGDATAHLLRQSGQADATTWARDGLRRKVNDPWAGCAHCHATGKERPFDKDASESSSLSRVLLPSTFAGSGGIDLAFRIDGAPRVAHGMEAQALATSPCFTRGGASCLACHDPHGGAGAALRDADPDASCRGCHAEIAAAGETHARHRMAPAGSVPIARKEPGGPAPARGSGARLPGCVDCHAPALVPFGGGDLARDHAISVPSPKLSARAGLRDACATCHPTESADRLERSMRLARREKPREREARIEAFLAATRATDAPSTAAAAGKLAGVLADPAQDAWSRASAAWLLAGAGSLAAPHGPTIEETWRQAADPVLAIAAVSAHARAGGGLAPLKERLASEPDWRVRMAIAGGLSARGDAEGVTQLDAMYGDGSLPRIARSDAGIDLAVPLIQQQACRRAASVLGEALQRQPLSVPGWLNMGVARACMGDHAGAREAFVRVLDLQPGHELAIRNLASLEVAESAGPPEGE